MFLLASLIYCLLMFVFPGQWVATEALSYASLGPKWVGLLAVNGAVYGAILAALRLGRFIDLETRPAGAAQLSLLDRLLDGRRTQWLPVTGSIAVGVLSLALLVTGCLPFPFVFLYAAVVAALVADFRAPPPAPPPPPPIPEPAFDPSRLNPPGEAEGENRTYAWEIPIVGTDGQAKRYRESFILLQAERDTAHGVTRYESPGADLSRVLPHYVGEQFGRSLQQIAAFFRRQTLENRWTGVEEMVNVVEFARSIPFATDQDSQGQPEYFSFPIETLWNHAGDCEDHAILAAALLRWLGHRVGFFELSLSGDSNHLALAYHIEGDEAARAGRLGNAMVTGSDGRNYYYVETLSSEAASSAGAMPAEFRQRLQEARLVLCI